MTTKLGESAIHLVLVMVKDREYRKLQQKIRQREAKRLARMRQSLEAKEAERDQQKKRMKAIRENHSPEAKEAHRDQNKTRMQAARANQSQEARESERHQNKKRMQIARVTQSPAPKNQALRDADDKKIAELSETILDMVDIDQETINLLARGQNYTKSPNCALAYYHLCSSHPDAFVFNDECLQGEEGKAVCQRLLDSIGQPIGKEEATLCQQSAARHSTDIGRIAYCASCNEVLFECDGNIVETTMEQIKTMEAFELTDEQLMALDSIPDEVVEDFVSVYNWNNNFYHLNPSLISGDGSVIVLCRTCADDPLQHKYSLANGHDYGRLEKFPDLSGMTLATVVPVRNYNIDILLRENHATGHSICFPSSGPVEAAKELPCHDIARLPLVTFLGPKDKWRIDQKKWQSVYNINIENAYKALKIWKQLGNEAFESVTIDDSVEKHKLLASMPTQVDANVIVTDNPCVSGVSNFIDETDIKDQDEMDHHMTDSECFSSNPAATDEPDFQGIVHSAVLPNPSLACGKLENNMAITALLTILKKQKKKGENKNRADSEKDADSDKEDEEGVEEEEEEGVDENESDNIGKPITINEGEKHPVIPVLRDENPITEWDENDTLLRGVFPHLFLLGKGVPKGEMKPSFIEHCFKLYDGRFEDPIWISTLFNQKQRHACIRRTAKIASSNSQVLEKLGLLANSKEFREQLIAARDQPESEDAKRLNAKICRILSMAGRAVPFSPFERVATRPMLQAMRFR
jgi:hypothetical protein